MSATVEKPVEDVIEVEDAGETSDYATVGGPSSTQSLSSSILDYVFENGRRYNRSNSGEDYILPNDETEQDRLDIIHHLQLLVLKGELFISPVKNPQRILDCGTGTGIWALDVGSQYPAAEIIGVDTAPIQPSWTYPNVSFQVDDLEKPWTFPPSHFDFIHSRYMNVAIRDWPTYLSQMLVHLVPGGYIELCEIAYHLASDDGTYCEGTKLWEYMVALKSATKILGVDFPETEEIAGMAREVGFEDVEVHAMKVPIGPWAKRRDLKEMGRFYLMSLETGFEAHGLATMTRALGYTPEKVKELSKGSLEEIGSKKVHPYAWVRRITARKAKA